MDPMAELRAKARSNPRRVVFPEGGDERILRAASLVAEERIALPILLGTKDEIVALGAPCCSKEYSYSFETVDGKSYEFENGMNTVRYLMPHLVDMPVLVEGANAVNYEPLVSLDPDVVFLREGSHGSDTKPGELPLARMKPN